MPHPSFQATGAPKLLEPEPTASKIHVGRPPNSGRSRCRLPLVAGLRASLYLLSPSLTAAELQGGVPVPGDLAASGTTRHEPEVEEEDQAVLHLDPYGFL
jgi:hypothetical protein